MFFIDTDLRSNLVYVVPLKQVEGREYTIRCENRVEAQKVKALLTKGDLRSPINNNEQFEKVEVVEKFGKSLTIFRAKK